VDARQAPQLQLQPVADVTAALADVGVEFTGSSSPAAGIILSEHAEVAPPATALGGLPAPTWCCWHPMHDPS
jgi:hypothetical protein